MKKIYQIIMLCAMSVAIASCSDSSNSNSHGDYKEACEEGDYQKAYSIINELKHEMQEYENENAEDMAGLRPDRDKLAIYRNLQKNFEDAEHYVVLQEATYILESQGMEGLTKIALIVKEHDAEWVYKDLADIAIAMGNDSLETRLEKLIWK